MFRRVPSIASAILIATLCVSVAAQATEVRMSRPIAGQLRVVTVPTVSESWNESARRAAGGAPAGGPIAIGHLPNFDTVKAIANARAARSAPTRVESRSTPLMPIVPALLSPQFSEFDGPDEAQSRLEPPDPIAAAGPNYIVVLVNELIAIYDKSGKQAGSFQLLNHFFGGMGIKGTFYDPRIIYDQADNVFILTSDEQRKALPSNSHVFIAVSQTSDPTGVWNKFAVNTLGTQVGGSALTAADFPTLGLSSSAIYISTGQFTIGGNQFSDTWLTVVGLAELLDGNPNLSVTQFQNVQTAGGHQAFAIEGALTYGTDPGEEFLAAADQFTNPSSTLNLFAVNTSGAPTLTAADLTTPSFSEPPDAVQPSTSKLIQTNDTRTINAVWQGNSLWTAHTIADPSGANAVSRWYEIGLPSLAGATLSQSGTVAGAGNAYFPAIAQQQDGAVVMGFTTSSAAQFASAEYAGRASTDPIGAMREAVISRAGGGIYDDHAFRWGDYSGASVDPGGSGTWLIDEFAGVPNPEFGTAVTQVSALGDVALSDGVLDFGDQLISTISAPQTLTLTNEGAGAVTLSTATLGGTDANEFAVASDHCSGTVLAPGANCTIGVTFTPASIGGRQATIAFSDSTGANSQVVDLGGVGVAPAAQLLPIKLTFAAQTVGTTSPPQTSTLTNTGSANLSVSQITVTGDFAETDNCIGMVAPNASCAINVTFTPTRIGTRRGNVTVIDNAGSGSQKVALSGTGM